MSNKIEGIKYFTLDEIKCPCCGKYVLQMPFIKLMDTARDIAGIPFIITSWYRCEKHNREIGGVPTSAHISGWAADINVVSGIQRFKIVNAIFKAYDELNFTVHRMGIGDGFIHIDGDPSKPNNVIWTYYKRH